MRMDKTVDEERRRRLRLLEEHLTDARSTGNVDCLLDTVTALIADCDHPAIRRMKNVEAYTSRCKSPFLILFILQTSVIVLFTFLISCR